MNKRIYEIAVQAKIQMVSEPRLQEFAELIIQECADISNQAEKQCQHPGTEIKKHFGVEE